jgi:hypothetical protein
MSSAIRRSDLFTSSHKTPLNENPPQKRIGDCLKSDTQAGQCEHLFLSLRAEGEAIPLSPCHCEPRRGEAISSTIRLLRQIDVLLAMTG